MFAASAAPVFVSASSRAVVYVFIVASFRPLVVG